MTCSVFYPSSCRPLSFVCLCLLAFGCKEDFSNIQMPFVTTGFVAEISDTSAMIDNNSNTSGGDFIIMRGICWSNILTEPVMKADDVYWEGSGSGTFKGYMRGLTPGITYYVQAIAQNSRNRKKGSRRVRRNAKIAASRIPVS